MSILKPYMRCLVIGEDRGCEANIGATLTITERDPDEPGAWLFKDASRPLVMLDCDGTRVLPERVSHSCELVNQGDEEGDCYAVHGRHLMPIKGDELDGDVPADALDRVLEELGDLAWARSVVEKALM